MKAIQLTAPALTAFRPTELPDPKAGPGEVLLRLRAATLNYLDVAIATGSFPGAQFPMIPVADGAGEIAALGERIEGWAVGDRVVPHFMPNWQGGPITPHHVAALRGLTLPGSLAEYVAVPAASLVALQFAKACGATAIVTSSSEEKLDRARRLGADHLINYRATPAWDEEVLKLTAGRGADLVVETVGGATFARALNAAAMGGTVFTVGFVSGTTATVDLLPIIVKALRIAGNNTGSVADLAEAARAIAAHRIVPVIDRVSGIGDTGAAYTELANGGRHFGKLAIMH